MSGSRGAIEDLRARIDKLAAFVADAVAEMEVLKLERSRTRSDPRQDFVSNTLSDCWHEVLVGDLANGPDAWKTRCGWRFGHAPHSRSRTLGAGARCAKCFQGADEGDSSGSSSSGSVA